eukprot:CAMPEP_0119420626 /NCGR_PEP_ID=MMETSP1335-20130426/23966_1 /TAXON_ID=259385 /ORGANISM="Chrysoculter rhomboideus, Strain RCC1486" /LENGTH=102 /DNA_ID=CAMNT_0007445993 /DNA_START=59 /DNA_END=364 /DNA_ORIENTATION=-
MIVALKMNMESNECCDEWPRASLLLPQQLLRAVDLASRALREPATAAIVSVGGSTRAARAAARVSTSGRRPAVRSNGMAGRPDAIRTARDVCSAQKAAHSTA